jgi:RHS repeat-associated protein
VHTRLAGAGESRITRYGTTARRDGTVERTHVLPDGVPQRAHRSPDGRAELRENDGSTIAVTSSSDPRFGMQAPLYSVDISTGGRTLSRTVSHEVELRAAGDPLTVVRRTETLTVNGRVETTVYDGAARTFTTTTPLGRIARRTIDGQGRATVIENPGLEVVTVGYTDFGRVASLTQGTGDTERLSSYVYDDAGLLSRETDALGAVTLYEHDAVARLTGLTLPGDRGVALGYDANGNVTSITPPGRPAHTFTFDAHNRPSGYAPPPLPGTGPTTIRYNLAGELVGIAESDGSSVEFNYDAGGRRTSTRLAEGIITASYENVTGQLTALDAFGQQRLAFRYDGALLRQLIYSGAVTGTVAYTYDNDLSVESIAVAGGPPVALRYDADDQLAAAGDLVIARDPARGTIAATTLGVIADRYTHDGFGDLTEYSAQAQDSALYEVTYRRDQLGRIASAIETIAGTTTSVSYTYDASGRLATVARNGTTTESYVYDANGNRTSGTVGAAVSAGSYDVHDRAIQYGAASFTYSANGSLTTRATNGATTSYAHDALGNLRAVVLPSGRRVDYVIDGESRRVGKQVDGRLVQGFLYDGDLRIVAELDGTGEVVSRFVYATGVNYPAYIVRGDINYRVVVDHVGSPRLIVDASTGTVTQRLDYDAFGNVVTDTNPGFQPFGFAGGLYDRDTGLVRFGARDYEPQTGRWITKDPMLFAGGDLNLYAYAGNDPINRADPTGTQTEGVGSGGGGSWRDKLPSWNDAKEWWREQTDKAQKWFGRKSDLWDECRNGKGPRSAGACVKFICETAPTKGVGEAGSAGYDAGENNVDTHLDNMNDRDREAREGERN